MIRIRIKATGQVDYFVMPVALAMLRDGRAERCPEQIETAALEPQQETAVLCRRPTFRRG